MEILKYSIQIEKPQAFVFDKVLDKTVYPEWTRAWGEGMTYEGEWKKGGYIAFHDNSQGGTKVVIEDIQPSDFIKMKHVAMVNSAAEEIELTDEMMKKWIGSLEQYYFRKDSDTQTTFEVVVETDVAFKEMMDGAWPKALGFLKAVCEGNLNE